ncbi:uncharacterized protein EV420DRAFT_1563358 [Desarmillaria tabescens]|uniref:Uncharacterized protein n=1 Tax=Armillaria tabescens TaxID=1929756 RepID=A0AA39K1E4_ARMTA|nr:uncharacterized protein EV420DRAFT_1563358 [Desarmillaria tabescens]KAK0450403.1 hypothetical protein EV420DRAFT_1563358 [Desarmillaria tabescens]
MLLRLAAAPRLFALKRPGFVCRNQFRNVSTKLGLRQALPPDSSFGPEHTPPQKDEISDQEWNLRTGRAITVLQQTLPEFFKTGLITSINDATGHLTSSSIHSEQQHIYSPKIRLSYTPPVQLPSPFPQTLHVEGLPLYLASSAFVRHTLNALYSDLQLTLQKFSVDSPRATVPHSEPSGEVRKSRDKHLTVLFRVNGIARVSGSEGVWDVHSTYTFSPLSGLIHIHSINSIEPSPHLAVYDTLRSSLGGMFGWGGKAGPAACHDINEGSAKTHPGSH